MTGLGWERIQKMVVVGTQCLTAKGNDEEEGVQLVSLFQMASPNDISSVFCPGLKRKGISGGI